MQSRPRLMALLTILLAFNATPAVLAAESSNANYLEGDTRLACEAILCLSSSTRPSECSPSLSRYFGIKKKKLSDTLKARLSFLELCPASEDSPAMKSLVRAISKGAGRCDAESLNSALGSWWGPSDGGFAIISDKRPSYCSVYASHEYTDFAGELPRYIGKPEELGYWVEARDYERELAKYEKALAERKEREKEGHGYGYQGD